MVVWWVLSTCCSMALSQKLWNFLSVMCQSQSLSQRSSCGKNNVHASGCHDPSSAHRANKKPAAFRVLSRTLKQKNSQNFWGFLQLSLQSLLSVLATGVQMEMKLYIYIFFSNEESTANFPGKFMLKFLGRLKNYWIYTMSTYSWLLCHSYITSSYPSWKPVFIGVWSSKEAIRKLVLWKFLLENGFE